MKTDTYLHLCEAGVIQDGHHTLRSFLRLSRLLSPFPFASFLSFRLSLNPSQYAPPANLDIVPGTSEGRLCDES